MSIPNRIKNAKKVDWLTKGRTESELEELREEAYTKAESEYATNKVVKKEN